MPIHVPHTLLACHECDLLQRLPVSSSHTKFLCPRCGTLIRRRVTNSIDKTLAWLVTGTILFAVANTFPFMGLNAHGQVQDSTLISSSIGLSRSGQPVLAILVLLTTVVFPLLDLLGLMFVLGSLKAKKYSPYLRPIFHFIQSARPWGMVEIFMLGVLVALVKLSDVATVIPGIALYAFAILIFVLAAANYSLDSEDIWQKIKKLTP